MQFALGPYAHSQFGKGNSEGGLPAIRLAGVKLELPIFMCLSRQSGPAADYGTEGRPGEPEDRRVVTRAGALGAMKVCFTAVVLFAVTSLPNLASRPMSTTQASTVCAETSLPAPISELLGAKFAGWRPQQISDLYGDDQKYWSESHPKECPGIAIGHFEFNDRLSYAVLLLPKSKQQSGYQIVVFSRMTSASPYTWKLLEHEQGKNSFAPVIYKVPPGKYVGFDTKSVRLKLDGLSVNWIEKSSFIDYWSEGHYHKIWTSD